MKIIMNENLLLLVNSITGNKHVKSHCKFLSLEISGVFLNKNKSMLDINKLNSLFF